MYNSKAFIEFKEKEIFLFGENTLQLVLLMEASILEVQLSTIPYFCSVKHSC